MSKYQIKGEKIKVAIVHDFLVQMGGAEKVLESLCEIFPDAPIYTLLYNKEKMHGVFQGRKIYSSYLQKFPNFFKKRYQYLLPFFLVIPETFDLRDFDLVISSSGAWSKGLVTKLDTLHIAYLHSPMRFVWDSNDTYLNSKKVKNSIFKRLIFSYVRIWDRLAAERPDYLIANSRYTQQRITKYYRRKSDIIYPPALFQLQADNNQTPKDVQLKSGYFLVVSRLSGYKKTDVIVEAFNKLELPLVIIGEGEQEKYLRKIAKENVKILSWKNNEELAEYYRKARAFIFAAEDDFGIAPVEAMSFGVPVIAFRRGGVLETVVEGVNGEFFDAQHPDVLADGIRRFIENEKKYDKKEIINLAQRFSKEKFKNEINQFLTKVIDNS